MSDYEEALDDFPADNSNTTAESVVGAFARNKQMNGLLQVESLQKIHHPLVGQLPGSNMRSFLKIGWILQCLK